MQRQQSTGKISFPFGHHVPEPAKKRFAGVLEGFVPLDRRRTEVEAPRTEARQVAVEPGAQTSAFE